MAPAQVVVNALLVVWLAYGAYTSARVARRGSEADRGSRAALLLGIFAPFAIGFAVVRAGIGLPDSAHAEVMAWAGAALMGAGIALWAAAIATLGDGFSFGVDVVRDRPFVDTGVYRLIRHPAYAGMLATLLGYGVASGDRLVALAFAAVPAAAFLYRIGLEERVLLDRFGDVYRGYMRRTKRLVPFVY